MERIQEISGLASCATMTTARHRSDGRASLISFPSPLDGPPFLLARRKGIGPALLSTAVLAFALLVSGCLATTGGSQYGAYSVGPSVAKSSQTAQSPDEAASVQWSGKAASVRLNVIVPVFDPGLSDEAQNYEKEGIWPELRRAEANRFAVKMKQAMEETRAFGAVRVTPDRTASGELYVLGTIRASSGAAVKIALDVVDLSGRLWMRDTFSHEVSLGYWRNIRNQGQDPYDPVFAKAAQAIVELLNKQKQDTLQDLRAINALRFGQYLVADAFSEHLQMKDDILTLVSLPSDQDPMLKRVQAAQIREQLFVDEMQSTYTGFSQQMESSYLKWQEASLLESEARRKARGKSLQRYLAGAALIGLAIAASVAGAQAEDNSFGEAAGAAGAIAGGLAGAWMLSNAFQSTEEAKLHQEALNELGESVDLELAPQVVSLEEKSVQLKGDASEQFAQWRAFLKRIHAQERTPEVLL